MKKASISVALFFILGSVFANEYEPEQISADLHTDVTMVFESMDNPDLGVTAVHANIMPGTNPGQDLIIKSFTETPFTVTKLVCVSMVQALDADEKELAYMVQLFTVKESALKKLNSLINDNQVLFSELIDSIIDEDLDTEMHGTQEAPDPEEFVKLRNLQVYDIYVTTSEGKEIHLQVYVEFFRNSEDL